MDGLDTRISIMISSYEAEEEENAAAVRSLGLEPTWDSDVRNLEPETSGSDLLPNPFSVISSSPSLPNTEPFRNVITPEPAVDKSVHVKVDVKTEEIAETKRTENAVIIHKDKLVSESEADRRRIQEDARTVAHIRQERLRAARPLSSFSTNPTSNLRAANIPVKIMPGSKAIGSNQVRPRSGHQTMSLLKAHQPRFVSTASNSLLIPQPPKVNYVPEFLNPQPKFFPPKIAVQGGARTSLLQSPLSSRLTRPSSSTPPNTWDATLLTMATSDPVAGPGCWRCLTCSKLYKSRELILNHIELEHPPAMFSGYKCVGTNQNCNAVMKSRLLLKHHVASQHWSDKTLRLSRQSSKTISPYLYQRDNQKKFSNPDVGVTKQNNGGEITNQDIEILPSTANMVPMAASLSKCPKCSLIFLNAKLMANHVAKKHKPQQQRVFKCKFCSFQRGSKAAMERHLMAVHGHGVEGSNWRCGHCGHTYPAHLTQQISDHMARVHPVEAPTQPEFCQVVEEAVEQKISIVDEQECGNCMQKVERSQLLDHLSSCLTKNFAQVVNSNLTKKSSVRNAGQSGDLTLEETCSSLLDILGNVNENASAESKNDSNKLGDAPGLLPSSGEKSSQFWDSKDGLVLNVPINESIISYEKPTHESQFVELEDDDDYYHEQKSVMAMENNEVKNEVHGSTAKTEASGKNGVYQCKQCFAKFEEKIKLGKHILEHLKKRKLEEAKISSAPKLQKLMC